MAAELTAREKSLVARFRDKARSFWDRWNRLQNLSFTASRLPASERQEYNRLMTKGREIKGNIEKIERAISWVGEKYDAVKSWLMSTFGLDGIAASKETRNQLKGLGIGPLAALIPVSLIVASLSAVAIWVIDVDKEARRLEFIDKRLAEGMSMKQAMSAFESKGQLFSMFGDMGKMVPIIGIGLIGVIGLTILLRK